MVNWQETGQTKTTKHHLNNFFYERFNSSLIPKTICIIFTDILIFYLLKNHLNSTLWQINLMNISCSMIVIFQIMLEVMESCKTDQGDLKLDSLWSFIGEMKDYTKNTLLFPRLWKFVRLISTIHHSNAKEEWVFSVVRKNKTSFQPRLDPEEALVSIVTVKLAMESESVETFNIPQEVLAAAKSATYKY